MAKYLVFSNPGEIDPRLITTMGVNVKPGPSPIGYFGTGLKYAIAGTLRLGGRIWIWSGPRQFGFESRTERVRGKEFGFVEMTECRARIPLAFTLDLGKDWKPWMLYRELYCNAKDEDGGVSLATELPAAQDGLTEVIVDCPELLEAHENRGQWLLDSHPSWACPDLEVHSRALPGVFFRGVKVLDLLKAGIFTYNLLAPLSLSEDRTISGFQAIQIITRALAHYGAPKELLTEVLTAPEANFEASLDWDYVYNRPEPEFIELVCKLRQDHATTVSKTAINLARRYVSEEELDIQPVELTRIEQAALARATEFLAKFLGITLEHPVVPVDSLGHHWVLGLASKGKIYLPKATFGKGVKYLAATLLEEHLHLKLGLRDESRELQDWLFDRVVSLGEELKGEPL